MQLESISLFQFKNYEQSSFDFKSRITCITGKNGLGKTNLLDAIHMLCLGKSYFNTVEKNNVLHERDSYSLKGRLFKNSKGYDVLLKYETGQRKKISCQNKDYPRISEHWGKFPVIFITPNDIRIIDDFSEDRRRFMDSIICQYDHTYLKELIKYNKILQHRNAALKKMREERMIDDRLLDILDEQMLESGSNIFEKRKIFEKEMKGIVLNDYARISGNAESAGFEYTSQLIGQDFNALLKDNRRKDLDMQRSNIGIHKDDYIFSLNGLMLKRFGSQGQKKSYVFALKLSLLKLLYQHSDVKPILLLDDIFDRLDKDRMKQLLTLIFEEKTGHFFLTDTDEVRVIELLKEMSAKFEVFNIKTGNLAEYEVFE